MDLDTLQAKKDQLERNIEKAIQDFIKETTLWPEIQIEMYEFPQTDGPPKPATFNVEAKITL